jgi:hypothetical protein
MVYVRKLWEILGKSSNVMDAMKCSVSMGIAIANLVMNCRLADNSFLSQTIDRWQMMRKEVIFAIRMFLQKCQ